MADHDEIRRRGAITDYRPDRDDVSGGRDKSVQSEALGAEGASDLNTSGSTSGGAAGRLEEIDRRPRPDRGGGERDDAESDLTR